VFLTDSLSLIYNKIIIGMTNKEILIKQIIYRSSHRGSKEMDLLLGNFVKKYVNDFNDKELKNLYDLLMIEDELIYRWYFDKKLNDNIPNTRVSNLLKKYKL
tara:strand:+ start:3936 stop:4241 length:306 start_codon:yes stop_codon:yes gene_type:complete